MSDLKDELKRLIDGLNFLSETDDFWEMFVPTVRRTGAVTSATMVALTRLTFFAAVDFDTFMDHTINSQTISQGQAVGDRYRAVKAWFVERLIQRKVFKMVTTPNRYEYYVVGIDKQNNLIGIFATAVET